jgi:hypothetical protein
MLGLVTGREYPYSPRGSARSATQSSRVSVAAPQAGKFVYSYIEFGRQVAPPSPIR